MAKTENITRYVCDRCGADAYLAANSAAAADWREIERVDQYGSRASRLLCKACTDDHKSWRRATTPSSRRSWRRERDERAAYNARPR